MPCSSIRVLATALAAFAVLGSAYSQETAADRILMIILDGCRPDYVTPDIMPNLYALGQRGVVSTNHHATYPTVTRVNSTTFSTGCYPAKHGIMGNSVYFPEVEPDRGLSTGDAENLIRIMNTIEKRLVTRPSMGEILESYAKTHFAVSSGSTGSAFLLNHQAKGGGVVNVEMIQPPSMQAHVEEVLGAVPEDATPNAGRNRWAVDAYLKLGLEEVQPDVTFMWLSDPDHTAHPYGVGDPVTVEALKAVDAELGRILEAHADKGLTDRVNIIVTSDHGFSTQTGETKLVPFLVQEGLKRSLSSTDVIVVGGCIYVDKHDTDKIAAIVRALQSEDWVGAIFTKGREPGSHEGIVPGTLSFSVAHFDHERAPDILVDANWSDAANEHGWKGTTALTGVAGHGTSSPYDIHNTLIVAGPAFKEGAVNERPTGNIDMVPTICSLIGIPVPDDVDGRVLTELLRGHDATAPPDVERVEHEVKSPSGEYRLTLHESRVGPTRYLDYTKTQRGKSQTADTTH